MLAGLFFGKQMKVMLPKIMLAQSIKVKIEGRGVEKIIIRVRSQIVTQKNPRIQIKIFLAITHRQV